jgi:hypothetical protein
MTTITSPPARPLLPAQPTSTEAPPVGQAPVERAPVEPTPRAPRSAARATVLTGAGGLAAVGTVVAVAPVLPDGPLVHDLALLAHLSFLALGFGAVLLIDLTGARWMLGRATLSDTARLANLAHPAIWIGMAGLVLSGALLHPDPTSDLTRAKLLAVVLACANGGYATHLGHRVAEAARRSDRMPRALMARGLAASAVSQLAWWTAVVVGWLNARA